MNETQPKLVVVGDQRLADILAVCGASWHVFPAVDNVNAMWDSIELGLLPSDATVLIVTDGTSTTPDEMEATLAAFAPYSRTYVVAASSRGAAITSRVETLISAQDGPAAVAPTVALPAEDLAAALALLQSTLAGVVAWEAPAAPAQAPAPAVAPQPDTSAYQALATVSASYEAPTAAPVVVSPAAPYAAPAAAATSSGEYEQAGIYDPRVAELASEVIAKLPEARPGQMTIACMSSKGGSGKSTTAIALAGMVARASAAAGDPKRVVLVDLDTRDGQVGSLIGQYLPTAVSIRLLRTWDANTVQANLVHDKRLGIDALLAPVRPRNADDVGPDFYKKIIQILQTTHDVVILDCSVNYLDPLLGVGFALADEILFVTTLATTSVQGMARSLTELFADPAEGGLGIPREKVGIVANAVINNVGMGKDKLLRAALGAPLVGQIPAEHDEVLIQTNSNRMDNLLKHHRLGPAYFNLAQTCLPNIKLAPLTTESAQLATPAAAPEQEKKRGGFFGR